MFVQRLPKVGPLVKFPPQPYAQRRFAVQSLTPVDFQLDWTDRRLPEHW